MFEKRLLPNLRKYPLPDECELRGVLEAATRSFAAANPASDSAKRSAG